MEELVAKLIEDLQTLEKNLSSTADLEERASRAGALLSATQIKLDTVKKELLSSNDELFKQRAIAVEKHNKEIYTKQGELRDLVDLIAVAKKHLTDTQIALQTTKEQHTKFADDLLKKKKAIA